MSHTPVSFRIELWKPSGEKHITPTTDLAEATMIRIAVHGGDTSPNEIEFLKERDPHMFKDGYQLDRLRGLLQRAFEQGRGHQAGVMSAALQPFGKSR